MLNKTKQEKVLLFSAADTVGRQCHDAVLILGPSLKPELGDELNMPKTFLLKTESYLNEIIYR